ncbi:MAG: hypothetical protein KDD56_02245 [Bdellovibrionales bacterium]|nr:hypothetical protein [Bdellovibrionales bacterium]
MFRKKISLLLLSVLALLVSIQSASADDLTLDLNAGFYSDYMFRGFNLYDGTSIQPAVGLGYGLSDSSSVNFSAWSHLSGEGGKSTATKFTEIDYTASYDVSFDNVGLSFGHIWYTYPADSDGINDTSEFFASIAFDTFLTPTVSAYHDYEEFDAQYYELGLSHTVETDALGDGFNMTPYVTFAFASNADKVYADDGLVHVTFGVSFDAAIGDVVLSPSLNVTREADDLTENEFWTGINFGYSM